MRYFILFLIFPILILNGIDNKICPLCKQVNPKDAVFCSNCGYKFQIFPDSGNDFIKCPNCNSKNPLYAKFCFNCGYNLSSKLFIKDSLLKDTSIFSSPIAESIYVELKRIRQLLLEEKIKETNRKQESSFDFYGLCFIACLGIIALSLLFIRI